MPLIHSKSEAAFKSNVRSLMKEVGKSPHVRDRSQALAIAYAVKRRGKAAGGGAGFGLTTAPGQGSMLRNEARSMLHSGPILSAVPGRTDRHNMALASGSYVVPAQAVSHLGQNNTLAGMKVLNGMFGPGGPYGGGAMKIAHGAGAPKLPHPASIGKRSHLAVGGHDRGGGRGGLDDHSVDVVTAGGEYVIPPHVVAGIGSGDIKHGHDVLDAWVNQLKQDHIRTLKKLPGPAKS